jgi:hypothetical protein
VLTEVAAALADMPTWAQVFLGVFALAFVVMTVGLVLLLRRSPCALQMLKNRAGEVLRPAGMAGRVCLRERVVEDAPSC